MRYRALLLDFDNTMVGTERHHHHIFKETIGRLIGRELTPADGRKFAGSTWKEIFQILSDDFLPGMEPAEIRSIFIKDKAEYFRGRIVPVAKGLEKLMSLDVKKAIVTGSSRPEVDMFADIVDLSRFDLIASDEFYEHGKPAPDAYLYAVKALGVDTESCLAVEDSGIGIRSAKGAGVQTVFTREFAYDDLSSLADCTVDTLEDICGFFR